MKKEEILSESGISTLEERREHLFNNFCQKTYNNERLRQQWLEERVFIGPDLRSQRIIKEKHANTNRLFNSPLYTVRRTINDQAVV